MVGEEGAADLAAVGVLPDAVEHILVEIDVVDVNRPVERKRDHLRNLVGFDAARDAGTVGGAEAVGEDTLCRIAVGRAVRVRLDR